MKNTVICPCGSQNYFMQCCNLYLCEEKIPETPELLMRSRYSAYALANINYIQKTMCGKMLIDFNPEEAEEWAKKVNWRGLQVINSRMETPEKGYVEFVAHFIDAGKSRSIHEISEFNLIDGHWFYVDGQHPKKSIIQKEQKVSRNGPCPCGSQKKFKNCHGKHGLGDKKT